MLDLLMLPGLSEVVSPIADTAAALLDSACALDSTQVIATEETSVSHRMMLLVMQIAILIFAAFVGGRVARFCKLPTVLGELLAGITVGPYLLGGIAIPIFFEQGIFPQTFALGSLSISPELYAFATLASIILLFMSGLETDLGMFLRYSTTGSMVAIGGTTLSVIVGMSIAVFCYGEPFFSKLGLYLGVLCSATSVGISARILSEKRKIDSSEGVTILAGAVFDDVIGIILLALVLGIIATMGVDPNASINWGETGIMAAKVIGLWLAFTVAGLLSARKISNFLKTQFTMSGIVIGALGIALIISTAFELSGLAMIIGAYTMGLALSKTELKFTLIERMRDIYLLFVPVFFASMGALVDVREFLKPEVLMIGGIYGCAAITAKVIGCGTPAFLHKFNLLGATRIGVGMIPRGEVTLIVGGLGMAMGVLTGAQFGAGIIMTLMTIIIAPPLFNILLDRPERGTRREERTDHAQLISFDFPHPLIIDMMIDKLHTIFTQEGFFITRTELDQKVYQMCKDDVAFSMRANNLTLEFSAPQKEAFFIKTAVYETLLDIFHSVEMLKEMNKPEAIREGMADVLRAAIPVAPQKSDNPYVKAIHHDCIRLKMNHTGSKAEVIRELVDMLADSGAIIDREKLFQAVMDRENQVSTGLQDGIAVPHARVDDVDEVYAAVGIVPDGMDFEALDGKPTKLLVLLASPTQHSAAHLQCLATLGAMGLVPGFMDSILAAKNNKEVYDIFCPDRKAERLSKK